MSPPLDPEARQPPPPCRRVDDDDVVDRGDFDVGMNWDGDDEEKGPSSTSKTEMFTNDIILDKLVVDPYLENEQVPIPEVLGRFSFRKLWAFSGPGFLMSIAYLDPGNIESDLQSGSIAKFKLLWLLFVATTMGLLVQRLAVRLGVTTGLHLAEMCYRMYHRVPRIIVWLMVEVAIIGSDMQEVIGTAIAIYLLSYKVIPLWAGVLITVVDTFTFLCLDKYGLRKMEFLFGLLISTMAITFGYEYSIVGANQAELFEGMVIPWCEGCTSSAFTQAVGIIGATIMPHNLYLHSALVKSRKIDRTRGDKIKEANLYYFIENCIALLISFVISTFVVAVFATGLYGKTNEDVLKVCEESGISDLASVFPNNSEVVSADIYSGGVFLGCEFGIVAMYIWAIGILAAGQSSTMSGCYAGQFAMEGFLNLQWSRWKRVLFTRTVAILPTFCVAYYSEIEQMTNMNDILNAVMSVQLPFALLPVLTFTSNKAIMGKFANSHWMTAAMSLLSIVVISINIYYMVDIVLDDLELTWWVITLFVMLTTAYLLLCSYLTLHLLISLNVIKSQAVKRFVIPQNNTFSSREKTCKT